MSYYSSIIITVVLLGKATLFSQTTAPSTRPVDALDSTCVLAGQFAEMEIPGGRLKTTLILNLPRGAIVSQPFLEANYSGEFRVELSVGPDPSRPESSEMRYVIYRSEELVSLFHRYGMSVRDAVVVGDSILLVKSVGLHSLVRCRRDKTDKWSWQEVPLELIPSERPSDPIRIFDWIKFVIDPGRDDYVFLDVMDGRNNGVRRFRVDLTSDGNLRAKEMTDIVILKQLKVVN
jgi:hypothetical protein